MSADSRIQIDPEETGERARWREFKRRLVEQRSAAAQSVDISDLPRATRTRAEGRVEGLSMAIDLLDSTPADDLSRPASSVDGNLEGRGDLRENIATGVGGFIDQLGDDPPFTAEDLADAVLEVLAAADHPAGQVTVSREDLRRIVFWTNEQAIEDYSSVAAARERLEAALEQTSGEGAGTSNGPGSRASSSRPAETSKPSPVDSPEGSGRDRLEGTIRDAQDRCAADESGVFRRRAAGKETAEKLRGPGGDASSVPESDIARLSEADLDAAALAGQAYLGYSLSGGEESMIARAVVGAAPLIAGPAFERGRAAGRQDALEVIAEIRASGWKHSTSCASGLAGDEGPCDCAFARLAALGSEDKGEEQADG